MPSERELQIVTTLEDRATKQLEGSMSRLQKTGRRLQSVGGKLSTRVTAPLAAAAGLGLRTAKNFDETIKSVQGLAKASGSSQKELDKLKDIAIEFGQQGIFGPREVATAMQDMVRDGFTPAQIQGGLLSDVYNTAAASGEEMEAVQIALSDTMQAFGLDVEESKDAVNAFQGVALQTPATIKQMGDTMRYAAPAARSLGIGVEGLSAAMGLMAGSGIRASKAGTALRRGLINLGNAGEDQQEVLNELGVQMYDAEGNMRDFVTIMKEMREGLSGMTKQQKQARLETLFGARAISGWSAVINSSNEEMDAMVEKTQEGVNVQEVIEERTDSLSGAISKLTAKLKALAIELIDPIVPYIKRFAGRLQGAMKWVTNLSPRIKRMGAVIAGLAAALGPTLFLLGTFLTMVSSISAPILGVVAAISALIAILASFGDSIKEVWTKIQESRIFKYLSTIAEVIWKELKKALSDLWVEVKKLWQQLKPLLIPALKVMAGLLGGLVLAAIVGAVTALTGLVHIIKILIKWVRKFVKRWKKSFRAWGAAIMKVIIKVRRTWKNVTSKMQNTWNSVWDTIKQKVDDIMDSIKQKIKNVVSWIQDQWQKVKAPINKMRSAASDIGGKFKSGLGAVNPFNDVLVKSDGQVVPISSNDNVLAFKGNGIGGGQVTVNVNAPVYGMDEEDVATQLGDKIIQQLNLSRKL